MTEYGTLGELAAEFEKIGQQRSTECESARGEESHTWLYYDGQSVAYKTAARLLRAAMIAPQPAPDGDDGWRVL